MTPLVLLPGLMCDAGLWQNMLPQLEAIGPLTFGDLSQGNSVDEMASSVLENCPERFILVGFSMGGFVAREIARRVPERVQGIILIATSCEADTPAQMMFKHKVAEALQQTRGAFRGLGHRAIQHSLGRQHEDDPQLVQQILDMSLRMGSEAYIRQLVMERNSDRHLLNEIRCPTLVVAAADDRMRTLTESRTLSELIPDAQLRVVEDSGHMIPLEQPALLATLLHDWIDGYISCG